MKNTVKQFFATWAWLLGVLMFVGLSLFLIFLFGKLLCWITPTFGPYILIVLIITGIVAAGMVEASGEKAGGAPY